MNKEKFVGQIKRIKNHFGDKRYSGELCELIWEEVRDAGDEWMKRTVDAFIGNLKQSDYPVVVHFREAFHRERQRAGRNDSFTNVLKTSGSDDPEEMRRILKAFDDGVPQDIRKKIGVERFRGPYDLYLLCCHNSEYFDKAYEAILKIVKASKEPPTPPPPYGSVTRIRPQQEGA